MLVLRVATELLDVLALRGVVEIGEARVIELQIGAAESAEPGDLFGVDALQVGPEQLHVRIDVRIEHRLDAAVVNHARRGNRAASASASSPTSGTRSRHRRSSSRSTAARSRAVPTGLKEMSPLLAVERDLQVRVGLHVRETADLLDEVHVPGVATDLAVRDAPSGPGLPAASRDREPPCLRPCRSWAAVISPRLQGGARLHDFGGAQQAADVLGAERGVERRRSIRVRHDSNIPRDVSNRAPDGGGKARPGLSKGWAQGALENP